MPNIIEIINESLKTVKESINEYISEHPAVDKIHDGHHYRALAHHAAILGYHDLARESKENAADCFDTAKHFFNKNKSYFPDISWEELHRHASKTFENYGR